MKIAIDISPIIYETGVSTYTRNLVSALLKIDSGNEYILFGGSLRRYQELVNCAKKFSGKVQKKIYPITPVIADVIWNKLHVFPIDNLVGKVDVFHSSDWTQPPTSAFKVTTVHDLVPLKFPEMSSPGIVSVHKSRFKWVIKEVDRVIVPSETTKMDCISLGIKEAKIRVIPEAPDPIFKPARKFEMEKLKRKHLVSGKYILAVGVGKRKNTDRIIASFEKVKIDLGVKLVIVGHKYEDFGQSRGVVYLGHIAESEMPVLYSGAECLVYPSLYEGFGLPILEAFACKTPVVTSNIGSMSEVADKSAILVDPNSVGAISDGIVEAVKKKEGIIKQGLAVVSKYSWEKTAEETLKVYLESKS